MATVEDLPEELLARILQNAGDVAFRYAAVVGTPAAPAAHERRAADTSLLPCCRHSTLSLVCRRWHSTVLNPELLRCVSVNLARSPWKQNLQSFCAWLSARAAGHVEQLDALLSPFPGAWPSAGAELQAAALTAALACCADTLTALKLQSYGVIRAPWDVSATVSALTQLRSLSIRSDAGVPAPVSLAAFSNVECLELIPCPRPVVVLNGNLPPSLTSLALQLHSHKGPLPTQVSTARLVQCMPSASAAFLRWNQ
jgi:hypothetical protein